jgi:hypothetical protein
MRNVVGNRLVDVYMCSNVQATETAKAEAGVFFTVFSYMLK